ncbi:MAG: Gldg family protein, partial [Anaerolineae bacterium]|nr:Gldg family protein [Anaerolineae bacterium]
MIQLKRDTLRFIILGIGLVALIVFAVAMVVTPGNKWTTVTLVSLATGILGIAGFVLIDPDAAGQLITGRTGQYTVTTWLLSIFFIAFVVAMFIIVRTADLAPIDVTENKEYRLTQETLDFLGEMNADVEAIAFYSTQDASGREEAELWLGNYARASNGRLTYRFVDPDRNPTEAQQYGVTRTGTIVFVQGDRNAQAIYPDERNMTSALVQVFIGDARQVFYLTGHGERDFDGFTPEGFSSAKDILTRGVFQLEPLNLATTGLTVPENAELLIIAGPVTQFSAAEVEAVKAYLDTGGKVLFLADPGSNAGALGSGVLGVDFNPEGRGFATSGNDGTARTWSSGGNPDTTLRGHTGAVFDVAYSPDGETLATISIDGTVRVWNANSGEEVRQLEGHSSGTGRLAFSP